MYACHISCGRNCFDMAGNGICFIMYQRFHLVIYVSGYTSLLVRPLNEKWYSTSKQKSDVRIGLRLGEGTIIGDSAILDARSGLDIGKNVNLSS